MKGRGQVLAALIVVASVVAASLWLQRDVGTKALASAPSPATRSGAWFCPHGGGNGWRVRIEIANPGTQPVPIRVRRLSEGKASPARGYVVQPGSTISLEAPSPSPGSATAVEYFGGWVAAAWVAHAGADQSGLAAEPCLPRAGSTWLAPDGVTLQQQDAWVVVMNPFASEAVFSISLFTDRDPPLHPGAWTNVVLKPFRSAAFHLNTQRLNYGTVSTQVDAKVGRVAVASLDFSGLGGLRSADGQLEPIPPLGILPGGADSGRTDLVAVNTGGGRADLSGTVLARAAASTIASLGDSPLDAQSSQTYPVTTDGPSALDLHVPAGVALVRRTYGRSSDQAATPPATAAAPAWVVLPAVGGEPAHPGLVLTNPGDEPADVTLTYLPFGTASPPAPVTVRVPAMQTVPAPSTFVDALPGSAILAVSSAGTVVAEAASYSLGLEGFATYAVALGAPIPGWEQVRP